MEQVIKHPMHGVAAVICCHQIQHTYDNEESEEACGQHSHSLEHARHNAQVINVLCK